MSPVVLFGGLLLLIVVLAVGLLGVAYLSHRRGRPLPSKVTAASGVALLVVGTWSIAQSGLVGTLPSTLMPWLTVAAYLAAALFVLVVLDVLIIGEYMIERRGRYIPDVVRTLLIGAELVAVALVVLRLVMGIDVVALVALPTVATAVVGVALKDTFARFFAGVELGKVVKVGDWINTMDKEGRVTHIEMEHVTLVTREQDHVTLPNDAVISAGIVNYTRPTTTHICAIDVEATYAKSPLDVCQVLVEAAIAVDGVLPDPKPIALVTAFNESGIQYRLKFPIADYARYPSISSSVRAYVWTAFHRNGIEIPFPQRVLHQAQASSPKMAETVGSRDIVSRLGAIDIFAVMNTEQLESLAASTVVQDYLPGERIIRQGEPGADLYVIFRGRADVRVQQDGLQSTVTTLDQGNFFGEMSLLTGAPRSATVVAATSLRLFLIGKSALVALLGTDRTLLERIGGVVATRQVETDTIRGQLSRESASLAMNTQRQSLIERMQAYLWGGSES